MVHQSPHLGERLALALAPLLIAACGGDVKSTQGTGGPPTHDAGDPKAQPATAGWNMLGYDLGSNYWNKAETKISASSVAELAKVWEFDTKASVTATPVISGGRVYVSTAPATPEAGGLIAIDLASGGEVWRNPAAGGYSSLALDSGVLYMHDTRGWIRAFDVKDGQQLWELETHAGATGFSSPIVTKDLVLVGGASGEESTVQTRRVRGLSRFRARAEQARRHAGLEETHGRRAGYGCRCLVHACR